MLIYGTFSQKQLAAFQKRLRVVVTLLLTILFFTVGCNKLKDPNAPQILSVSHSSPSNFRTPVVSGTADADLEISLFSLPGCNGSYVGRGRSDSLGNFAVAAFVLAEGSYDFSVQAAQGDKTSCSTTSKVYNLDITPPTIVISAPSASLVSLSSAAVNFTVTYSGATTVNLTADKINLNKTGTAVCSAIIITNGTTLNPQIAISNCSGIGTVGFTIAFGSAVDDVGNSATATSSLFSVDNNAITSAVFNPASSTVGAIPIAVNLNFTKTLSSGSVSNTDFTVSGSCVTLPVLTVTSTIGATISTNLTGGSCSAVGQTVVVSLNLALIQDAAGNPGSGIVSATYTFDNIGPTSAVFNPVTSTLKNVPTIVSVIYNEAIDPVTVSSADFSVTGTCSVLPVINVSSVTATTAILSLSGVTCMNNQTVILTANHSGVRDTIGNLGSSSSSATYTLDTLSPAVLSISPTTSSVANIPTSVSINFSENILTASVQPSDLTITSTCSNLPTASVLSVSGSTINFSISAATCMDGQKITFNLSGASVTDVVGNSGTGSINSVLTFDATGPIPLSVFPSTGFVNATPTTVSINFNENVNSSSVAVSDLNIAGSCSVLPAVSSVSVSGMTATFSLAASTCTNGQTAVLTINGTSVTDIVNNVGSGTATTTYTIDTTGPTPSSINPLSQRRASMPTSVSIIFDENIQSASVAASDLGISGTCSALPTASVTSIIGSTVTFGLSASTCAENNTLTLSVVGSSFNDLLGNAGSNSQSVTYTLDTTGPSITSFNPATSNVLTIPFSMTLNFNETIDASTFTIADLSVSGTCTTLPTASVGSVSANSATVSFSGAVCASNQKTILTVNQAGINDTAGNAGVSTSVVTYTLDNTGPTISNFNPATGAPPTTINIIYSENILASSVSAADYTVSGSCLMLPTVSVSSVSGNVVTISLSGAVCVSTETVQVSTNAASVTDLLSNVGAGSSSVTYIQP